MPWIDEPFDIEPLQNLKVPDEDNALEDYRQAVSSFVKLDVAAIRNWRHAWLEVVRTPPNNGHILPLCRLIQENGWAQRPVGVDEWLDDNRVALEHWTQGASKPDYQYFTWGTFDTDETDPFSGKSTAPGDMSGLAALSCLQAMRLQANGEAEAAWNQLVVNLRAGHHISRHGHLWDARRAEEILEITQPSFALWAQQPNVDANLLQKALSDLAAEESRRPNVALAALHVAYGGWVQFIMAAGNPTSPSSEETGATVLLFLQGEPQVSSRTLRHIFAGILPEAAKKRPHRQSASEPYCLYEPTASHSVAHATTIEVNRFIAASSILRTNNPVPFEYLNCSDSIDTRHQLLSVMLSLELFKRVHGTYPDKLDQLTTVNPSIVLTDLFHSVPPAYPEWKQLRYHYYPPDSCLRVYSVGVDGCDNGGVMAENAWDDIGFLLGKQPK